MTKHTDDNHDAAAKPVATGRNYDTTLTVPGETGPALPPELPTSRLRRIPAVVDADGLDEITRAVALKLAMMLMLGKTTPEMYGAALTAIAREWTHNEMAHMGGRDNEQG